MDSQDLRTELDGVGCAVCGNFAQWQIHGAAEKRLNSVTAVIECPSCEARFFLKRLLGAGSDAAQSLALEEFNAAQRAYATYPSSDDYAVVKPHRLIPDKHLILFEYVEGRNASDLLIDLSASNKQVVVLERIGSWLRRFHDATGPTLGPADLPKRLALLKARSVVNRPSSKTFDRLLAYLSDELRRCPGTSVRHVGLHGDCKPENFLFRGSQIIGIDIAWKHRNAAEYDLGQFLAQLDLLVLSIRGCRLGRLAKELEAAFLRGYGRGCPYSLRIINWLRVYYHLSYWLSWRTRGYFQRLVWDVYFALLLWAFLRVDGVKNWQETEDER